MSWLARSIANTLKLDDDEDGDDVSNPDQNKALKNSPSHGEEQIDDPSSPTSPSRGVKEDISELTKTLTRQFWGVASFLAPPPQAEPDKSPRVSDLKGSYEKSESNSDSENSEQVGIGGIKSDFAEIGGKFRSGISKLSSNIAVSEFTKIASNLLQLGSDDEVEEADSGNEEGDLGRGAIGVTDEVVAFARDISMHPGTWLDFPLPGDEDDDSFELSDIQQEHALAVERLVPLLSSLRMELCPGYMSESLFWKIYFVLLHPQLNEQDAALLSTSQVLETRALLSHKLPSRPTAKPQEGSGEDVSSQNLQLQSISKDENVKTTEKPETCASASADGGPETEKHAVESSEIQIVDKSMIEEDKHVDQIIKDGGGVHSGSSSRPVEEGSQVEDDYDDWLKEDDDDDDDDDVEESSERVGPTTNNASSSRVSVENEEDDVSFSDLEEDDDDEDGKAPTTRTTSLNNNNARDWLQVNKASSESSSSKKAVTTGGGNNPETKDSTDWLDVDIDDS